MSVSGKESTCRVSAEIMKSFFEDTTGMKYKVKGEAGGSFTINIDDSVCNACSKLIEAEHKALKPKLS